VYFFVEQKIAGRIIFLFVLKLVWDVNFFVLNNNSYYRNSFLSLFYKEVMLYLLVACTQFCNTLYMDNVSES